MLHKLWTGQHMLLAQVTRLAVTPLDTKPYKWIWSEVHVDQSLYAFVSTGMQAYFSTDFTCLGLNIFMPPTSKKLREHIGFGLSVHPSICSSKTVHARVLKFHIWIPHGKIVDARFFFLSWDISLSGVMPLWKNPPSLIRVFAVRMKKAWVLSYPLRAQRRLWSDWADAFLVLSYCGSYFCCGFREETEKLKEGEIDKIKNYSALCWSKTPLSAEQLYKLTEMKVGYQNTCMLKSILHLLFGLNNPTVTIVIPPANCVYGGVYCFHVVHPLVRPSVTFWFFNILKRQWLNFIKFGKHIDIHKMHL